MAVIKCKMCGGSIEFEEGTTIGVCDCCGTRQTLPRLDDERRANLYDRANHFRRNNDFDKAAGIYEQILNEDTSDAEAYWSLVLCKYGIEYVEDPATKKRVPTVNRAQYTSVFDDENYKEALKYADSLQKSLYEEEAGTINEIQKNILEISQKEEPFDVFICYKETDANGRRTPDSVLANDLYHQLTQEGFKVFFSRITLEDKLGTAYEPYIFAALNSAKVMVVLGTKQEYFNAVWVKNEWSRFLNIVKKSGGKKVLIPAYRDMDPYDLPEEFAHLQAQDMSKLGFMQDLIRGIRKIAGLKEVSKENVPIVEVKHTETGNSLALLKRGNLALEDGDWESAATFFENVLNQDAECSDAYLGKFLAQAEAKSLPEWVKRQKSVQLGKSMLAAGQEDTTHIETAVKKAVPLFLLEATIRAQYGFDFSFSSEQPAVRDRLKVVEGFRYDRFLSKAIRFAQADKEKYIQGQLDDLTGYWEERLKRIEAEDKKTMTEVMDSYRRHLREADGIVERLARSAEEKLDQKYRQSVESFDKATSIHDYQSAQVEFSSYGGYRDSLDYVKKCSERIQDEENRIEQQKRDEEDRILRQKQQTYDEAVRKLNDVAERVVKGKTYIQLEKDFNECIQLFNSILHYKDSQKWTGTYYALKDVSVSLSTSISAFWAAVYCGPEIIWGGNHKYESFDDYKKRKYQSWKNYVPNKIKQSLSSAEEAEKRLNSSEYLKPLGCVKELEELVQEVKGLCKNNTILEAINNWNYDTSYYDFENPDALYEKGQKAYTTLINCLQKSILTKREDFRGFDYINERNEEKKQSEAERIRRIEKEKHRKMLIFCIRTVAILVMVVPVVLWLYYGNTLPEKEFFSKSWLLLIGIAGFAFTIFTFNADCFT